VPASDVDGEVTADTQPFPLKPPPFARQVFTPEIATNRTPEAHRALSSNYENSDSAASLRP